VIAAADPQDQHVVGRLKRRGIGHQRDDIRLRFAQPVIGWQGDIEISEGCRLRLDEGMPRQLAHGIQDRGVDQLASGHRGREPRMLLHLCHQEFARIGKLVGATLVGECRGRRPEGDRKSCREGQSGKPRAHLDGRRGQHVRRSSASCANPIEPTEVDLLDYLTGRVGQPSPLVACAQPRLDPT
jgi:hypothetical protein